jgi:hypothetical protein
VDRRAHARTLLVARRSLAHAIEPWSRYTSLALTCVKGANDACPSTHPAEGRHEGSAAGDTGVAPVSGGTFAAPALSVDRTGAADGGKGRMARGVGSFARRGT